MSQVQKEEIEKYFINRQTGQTIISNAEIVSYLFKLCRTLSVYRIELKLQIFGF